MESLVASSLVAVTACKDCSDSIELLGCRISDPTGVIWGIKLYRFIIANLFDPQDSSIQLKNISITGPANIEAVWAKEGFLQLPWRPYLTRQEGKTVSCGIHSIHCDSAESMIIASALFRAGLFDPQRFLLRSVLHAAETWWLYCNMRVDHTPVFFSYNSFN